MDKTVTKHEIKEIEEFDFEGDEYVYDVVMKNPAYPYFVANDILVHNSSYFSIADSLGGDIKNLTTEQIIETYDAISEQVNGTFNEFMTSTFCTNSEYAKAIRCDREVVGKRMYVVTKKKYSILVIDDEGQRKDVDGKEGKYKIVGLDIRRSDTPKMVQEWLSTCLKILLQGGDYKEIENHIHEYAEEYRKLKPWEIGAPKAANGITKYMEKEKKHYESKMRGDAQGKLTVPGHVAGAINWNTMLEVHSDKESDKILDGMKIVFCYLKRNAYEIDRVSWPADQLDVPDWFRNLPFDVDVMFQKNFVQKFYMLFRKTDIDFNFKSMHNAMAESDITSLFSRK